MMNEIEEFSVRELQSKVEDLTVDDFEYLHATEGLSPDQWEGLSVNERLETLQTLEDKLAEIQGRPPVAVLASETPGENGHYDPATRTITLNIEQLNDADCRMSLIDTIAHEGRHAYQHYAVEHPGFHGNHKEVSAWRENFKNYVDGHKDGLLAYRLQPLEADAWRYGHLVSDALGFAEMDAAKRKSAVA